jgi:hypothetical protein
MANKRNYKKGSKSNYRSVNREKDTNKKNDENKSRKGQKTYLNSIEGSPNDVSWYKKLPAIFNKATNVTWYNQLGSNFSFMTRSRGGLIDDIYPGYDTVPGILSLNMFTGPGTVRDPSDPMNISAISLFEYVRKALNKPNPDYEQTDLAMYLYAVMDIYAQYCNIMRAFGIVNLFDADNMYVPYALAEAGYGWNRNTFNYVVNNRANLLLRFDELIYKASWLFLPTNFTLMERQAWMFTNIFRDGGRTKSQFYIHRKRVDWLWDETTFDEGSSLQPLKHDDMTLVEMLDRFNTCIEAIRNSSSARIMQSDLRKAFENSSSWDMATTDPNYTVSFTVSDEVLSQIENATLTGDIIDFTNYNTWVRQSVDTNTLYHFPVCNEEIMSAAMRAWEITADPVINMHKQDPTPDDLMVATRNTVYVDLDEETETIIGVQYASDFMMSCDAYTYNYGDFSELQKIHFGPGVDRFDMQGCKAIATWFTFDWAPRMVLTVNNSNNVPVIYPLVEWDNYTAISREVVNNLHKVANFSMWYSETLGSWADASV